jgi:hypothetical protein
LRHSIHDCERNGHDRFQQKGLEMKTPDHEVANRILQEFRKKIVLSEKGVQKISLSLANGALKAEDWRLLFETDRLEKETDDAGKSQ